MERFHSLFPSDAQKVVLVGNHDIGFHYDVTPEKRQRFYGAFGLKSKVKSLNPMN